MSQPVLLEGLRAMTLPQLIGILAVVPLMQPPRLVVVFIIGGTTYEEARAVAELNAAGEKGEGWSAGMRIALGGTSVQSSSQFLKDMQEVMLNERYAS
jgi:hypothetical protein